MSFITWVVVALFVLKILRMSWTRFHSGATGDFYYFWDAGAKVLSGHAARAYMAHAIPGGSLLPLPHPPPFLLLVPVLALLPVGVSLFLFLAVTGAAYVVTARQPVRVALANPTVPYNVYWAQTGFLTSAILFGGLNRLAARPVTSGIVLGFMVIKPHLAILIPVALVAARQWKALAAAAGSVAAEIALAAFSFGPAIYVAWWTSIRRFGGSVEGGAYRWTDLSSVYALLRSLGLNDLAALAGQGLSATAAGIIVVLSWRQNWESRTSVLAAATMLVPPYLCSHDAVMMVGPLGWLAARSNWRVAIVWLLLLIPWFNTTLPNPLSLGFGVPDTTPIAAALSLFFLWRDREDDQSTLRMVSS